MFITKTNFFLFSFLLFVFSCNSQKKLKIDYNLGFEKLENHAPTRWYTSGNKLDSVIFKSGKYSAVIELTGATGELDFKTWTQTIKEPYNGKRITLSGYIKTENVEGFAGLWMRIDPSVAFDNMHNQGLKGTNDWKKYEITLDMNPEKTEQIVIGALLSGKGKIWVDDLQITIDGKNIEKISPIISKAEQDKEFDKGSQITFPALNKENIANLELLGKVWGFLKYYHPVIAKGDYNWDYELFRILPGYLKIENMAERDKFLLNWVNKYGIIKKCKDCEETRKDAVLKPDITWTKAVSPDLSNKLNEIYANRNQKKNYYVEFHSGVGNARFKNEKSYFAMSYPDAGFRLLCLYRYWNMINYFFPYKYLTDKNWETIMAEYIPVFINTENELEYELAATKLIGEIHDTHANLRNGGDKIQALRGPYFPPVQVNFIENKLVVTDCYKPDSVQLKAGDIITHINREPVDSIVSKSTAYYPASNQSARLRNLSRDILRSVKDKVHIDYITDNETKSMELPLYGYNSLGINYNQKKSYTILDNNIGYVWLGTIKKEDLDSIKVKFRDTKGIIIDIRNYPSTFAPYILGSYFTSEKRPFVKFTMGNMKNIGEFTYTVPYYIEKSDNPYKNKLILIVNEVSQSQAEFTAMAFQTGDNTITIGSQTAGADGNVSEIILPGGLTSMISGIGVYYPDGTETQRIGIVPDIEVKPTIKGIKEGRDELLEKAIEIILKK